ncbi:hypothetical protein DEO72_LG3g701 [Vigna unguiculata]|uniref:Uncharacterized protein n=1 Tax=Vigna unguiculata TaxID=3917 RepID=A0A4D6LCH4_VIGUN|nr:hypothetical protein DEO72_LG3g701 [Vigna unguiculata]
MKQKEKEKIEEATQEGKPQIVNHIIETTNTRYGSSKRWNLRVRVIMKLGLVVSCVLDGDDDSVQMSLKVRNSEVRVQYGWSLCSVVFLLVQGCVMNGGQMVKVVEDGGESMMLMSGVRLGVRWLNGA